MRRGCKDGFWALHAHASSSQKGNCPFSRFGYFWVEWNLITTNESGSENLNVVIIASNDIFNVWNEFASQESCIEVEMFRFFFELGKCFPLWFHSPSWVHSAHRLNVVDGFVRFLRCFSCNSSFGAVSLIPADWRALYDISQQPSAKKNKRLRLWPDTVCCLRFRLDAESAFSSGWKQIFHIITWFVEVSSSLTVVCINHVWRVDCFYVCWSRRRCLWFSFAFQHFLFRRKSYLSSLEGNEWIA